MEPVSVHRFAFAYNFLSPSMDGELGRLVKDRLPGSRSPDCVCLGVTAQKGLLLGLAPSCLSHGNLVEEVEF